MDGAADEVRATRTDLRRPKRSHHQVEGYVVSDQRRHGLDSCRAAFTLLPVVILRWRRT